MITKRVNTDLLLNLLFKDKLTGLALNYIGANNMILEVGKHSMISTKWVNQEFTLTDDGVLHFQWNSEENDTVGIFDARISFYKTSSNSETGIIQYRYDAISLFQIIPTSDVENTETETTNTISVSVSWGGADGMSAYEIAVKHGFPGTEAEFAAIERNNAANEIARQTAETARNTTEGQRQTAETARNTTEGQRQTAETARNTTEGQRQATETSRNTAESARNTSEGQRQAAETARNTAESDRNTAESERNSEEGQRYLSETARNTAESQRQTAETIRNSVEGQRQIAETARQTAETARNTAEGLRQTASSTAVTNANNAAANIKSYTNELNVDKLYPIGSGYYTISTAIVAISDDILKKTGIKISFQSAAGIFETWQFKSTVANWSTATNWERILVSGKFGNTDLVTDLNTIQRSGKYTAYGTATNVPNSLYSWFIDHINSSIGTLNSYQKAVAYKSTPLVYERTMINNAWGSWTLIPSRTEIDANTSNIATNTSDIAELKLGSGYYCISGWDPTSLSPTPISTKGNQTWLRDLSHVYLFDLTQNTGSTMRPVGELQRANWLRYTDGTFAPVIGITEAMRATCDVALYLDAAQSNLYSAAGAFNATTFYNLYGMTQKLYDASGIEVRILRPWETTSTNYSIGVGFSEKVWLIDGLGASGTYWQGLSQHELTWDGVKGIALERTAINPCPVTTIGNKTRCFFYLYNTGDTNTVSAIGKNNLCTLFSGLGRTFPRVNDMQQVTNMTYARANNSVVTNPYPVAEGGYHALNAAITRREVLFGTRYLHNPALFGSGISSNDSCTNEATFLTNGGFKYKVSSDINWSYCNLGTNPSIYYNAISGITNASDLLNQQYPKEQCLESQMAASFAKETGVSAGTDFTFYGSTYQWRNVTGVLGLADGRMNVIITKVMTQTISAFNAVGAVTSFDISCCLRMSLCDGINESGDIFMYSGGGYEQVGTCISTVQPHTGDTVDLYLQQDQTKWTNTSDITKNSLGTFDFEKLYTKLATVTNLGDNYTKTRQSLTPWKVANGGGISTGQCFYVNDNNYWSTTLQQRVRISARFRGSAVYGSCSPRDMAATIAASLAAQFYGGSAQILIG